MSMGGHWKLLYIDVAAENTSKATCPPNIPSLNLEANITSYFTDSYLWINKYFTYASILGEYYIYYIFNLGIIINSIIILNLHSRNSIILSCVSFVVCTVNDHTPNGDPE